MWVEKLTIWEASGHHFPPTELKRFPYHRAFDRSRRNSTIFVCKTDPKLGHRCRPWGRSRSSMLTSKKRRRDTVTGSQPVKTGDVWQLTGLASPLSTTMKEGMIQLKPCKPTSWEGGLKSVPVKFAYPYFKSGSGTYVHRVRSATTHVDKKKGENSHVSLHAWCGCIGFVHPIRKAKTANQFAEPPTDALFCATCEGRAIGAGCDSNRQINGRNVMYQPRPK